MEGQHNGTDKPPSHASRGPGGLGQPKHHRVKKKDWKLLVDTDITHGAEVKVFRTEGIVAGKEDLYPPVVVSDPRTRRFRPLLNDGTIKLKPTRFYIDDHYVGPPPAVEVSITDLNDNIDGNYLKGLISKFGDIRKLEIFYHPTTKRHMGLARVIFKHIFSAHQCVVKMHKTSHMGKVMSVFLDPFGRDIKKIFDETVNPPPPKPVVKETPAPAPARVSPDPYDQYDPFEAPRPAYQSTLLTDRDDPDFYYDNPADFDHHSNDRHYNSQYAKSSTSHHHRSSSYSHRNSYPPQSNYENERTHRGQSHSSNQPSTPSQHHLDPRFREGEGTTNVEASDVSLNLNLDSRLDAMIASNLFSGIMPHLKSSDVKRNDNTYLRNKLDGLKLADSYKSFRSGKRRKEPQEYLKVTPPSPFLSHSDYKKSLRMTKAIEKGLDPDDSVSEDEDDQEEDEEESSGSETPTSYERLRQGRLIPTIHRKRNGAPGGGGGRVDGGYSSPFSDEESTEGNMRNSRTLPPHYLQPPHDMNSTGRGDHYRYRGAPSPFKDSSDKGGSGGGRGGISYSSGGGTYHGSHSRERSEGRGFHNDSYRSWDRDRERDRKPDFRSKGGSDYYSSSRGGGYGDYRNKDRGYSRGGDRDRDRNGKSWGHDRSTYDRSSRDGNRGGKDRTRDRESSNDKRITHEEDQKNARFKILFRKVNDHIQMDLDGILTKDFTNKITQFSGFKTFEDWWDSESQRHQQMNREMLQKASVVPKIEPKKVEIFSSSHNFWEAVDLQKQSVRSNEPKRLGLGLNSLMRMPSFKKRTPIKKKKVVPTQDDDDDWDKKDEEDANEEPKILDDISSDSDLEVDDDLEGDVKMASPISSTSSIRSSSRSSTSSLSSVSSSSSSSESEDESSESDSSTDRKNITKKNHVGTKLSVLFSSDSDADKSEEEERIKKLHKKKGKKKKAPEPTPEKIEDDSLHDSISSPEALSPFASEKAPKDQEKLAIEALLGLSAVPINSDTDSAPELDNIDPMYKVPVTPLDYDHPYSIPNLRPTSPADDLPLTSMTQPDFKGGKGPKLKGKNKLKQQQADPSKDLIDEKSNKKKGKQVVVDENWDDNRHVSFKSTDFKREPFRAIKPDIFRPPVKTFKRRTPSMETSILFEFLHLGIDEEDIQLTKEAYRRLQREEEHEWLSEVHWVDLAPTLTYTPPNKKKKNNHTRVHSTGCARTEGFYKLTREERMTYSHYAIEEKKTDPKNKKNIQIQASNREARSNQRRLLTTFDGQETSLLKFNQLQFRKKQLRFARSKIHDWGLFAMEPIGQDEMVIEYVGQTIRSAIVDEREKMYNAQGIGSSYLFRIDNMNIIDATRVGNLARFINHSCTPNCTAKIITVEGEKKIVIYSRQPIGVDEEITYDYKFPLEDVKIPCLCGTTGCKGFLN